MPSPFIFIATNRLKAGQLEPPNLLAPRVRKELTASGDAPPPDRIFAGGRLLRRAEISLKGWGVYGAKRAQPVATGRKWERPKNGSNRRIGNPRQRSRSAWQGGGLRFESGRGLCKGPA
jgi:hypothetical protein